MKKHVIVFSVLLVLFLLLSGCSNGLTGKNSDPDASRAAGGSYNYGEALQKAILFYEAQRCGDVSGSDNRVSWRSDCHMNDGSDVGIDLTGGWHDAGDHIKFNLPMSYSAGTLLWSAYENAQAYKSSGQYPYLLSNIRYALDYLMKTHVSPNVIYYQVSNKSYDHNWWGSAEVFDPAKPRPAYKLDTSNPGSCVAGDMAATFAMGYLVFKDSDPAYAASLLQHARDAYTFANTTRSDAGYTAASGMYNSWSGFWDELLWAATWLHLATGNASYLADAESIVPKLNKQGQSTDIEYQWAHCWDDKHYGALLLLSRITGKAEYRNFIEKHLDWWAAGARGNTPYGLSWMSEWGSLRYASTAAFLAFVYNKDLTDPVKKARYTDFAEKQINYILGDNPNNFSYMIGFGSAWPLHPHHRTAHGNWSDQMGVPAKHRHTLTGAIVGGPSSANDSSYTDSINDYQANEVATDYNAGLVGALSFMYGKFGGSPMSNFPVDEVPDSPEFFNEASINGQSSNYTEIKILTNNRSAWPARYGKNLTFRYFFDISELVANGYSINNVTLATNYVEFPITKKIAHWIDNIYYVECTFVNDMDVAPRSQSAFAGEVQLRIQAPSGTSVWNPSNDFSYQGLVAGNTNAAITENIPVYSGGILIYGKEPPREQDTTPPAFPKSLTITGKTLSSLTLDWADNTESDLAGYRVYRGTTSGFTPTASNRVGTPTPSVFTNTALSANTTYYYAVSAVDTSGNESSFTRISGKTDAPDTTAPAVPVGLMAAVTGTTTINLSWTANTESDLAGYRVYRGTSATTLTQVGTPATASFANTGLTANTTYWFAVAAVDSSGNISDRSAAISAKTNAPDTMAPAVPAGLMAAVAGTSSINLNWTANSENDLAGYRVYRGTSATTLTLVGSPVTASYSNTGLAANTTYWFAIAAIDTSGNLSARSAAISAKTNEGNPVSLKMQFFNGDTNASSNTISTRFRLVNNSGSGVDLSRVTIRYWFTKDSSDGLNFWCDYAGGPITGGWDSITASVNGTFNSVSPARTGADTYLEVSFATAAGTLKNGGYADIQGRTARSNWSNFNQSNDYSFSSTGSAPVDYARVTVYVDGIKVWGEEP